MRIGKRDIDLKSPCFVIAEARVNHNVYIRQGVSLPYSLEISEDELMLVVEALLNSRREMR